MEKKQKNERSLKDYIDILIPKLWLILLVGVVCAAALFTFSFTRADSYTSSSTYLITYTDTTTQSKIYETQIATNTINKYKSLVGGDSFCDNAVRRINSDAECNVNITKSQFKSIFKFTAGSDDQTFSFSITYDDKNTAYNIANVVGKCLIEEIESFSNTASTEEIIVISEPQIPSEANSKNSVRNALIAFLVGVILTAGVVLVIALLDVTIHDKKKIEDNFDIPIIGVIPYQSISGGADSDVCGGHNENKV